MGFTKKDFYFSVVTGIVTGFVAWKVLEFLGISVVNILDTANCPGCTPGGLCPHIYCIPDYLISFSAYWLVLIVPVLWILGVNLGYFLGRWLAFFNQFGKFAAIGFTNAAVDFGVLNLLIANTGITAGIWYSVFKATSFISAVIPSYFWNKHWAFEAKEDGGGFEFAKFISVAVVSILINTGVASLVVNFIDPVLGFDVKVWANVGAVAGSAVALILSFVGFKKIVFKQ